MAWHWQASLVPVRAQFCFDDTVHEIDETGWHSESSDHDEESGVGDRGACTAVQEALSQQAPLSGSTLTLTVNYSLMC
jgi:hypothetical protein